MAHRLDQFPIASPEFDRMAAMGYTPDPNGYPAIFHNHIFNYIDEEPYNVLFNPDGMGADPIPVKVKIASLILRENCHDSLKVFADRLRSDVALQYAIHCTGSYQKVPSLRCLQDFKKRLKDHLEETGVDLLHDTFVEVSARFCEETGADLDQVRADTFLLESYIEALTRYKLIYDCVARVVKVLAKNGVDIPEQLKHFLEPADRNIKTYHDKDTSLESKFEQLLSDAQLAWNSYGEKFKDLKAVSLLKRVIYEQTTTGEDGALHLRLKGDPVLRGEKPAENAASSNGTGDPSNGTGDPSDGTGDPSDGIGDPSDGTGDPSNGIGDSSDGTGDSSNGTGTPDEGDGSGDNTPKRGILQSPVDPDATFNGKRGEEHRGYSAVVLEVPTKSGPLILDYHLGQNIVGDNTLAREVVKSLPTSEKGGLFVGDGTFNGAGLKQDLADKNYALANTNLTGRKSPDCFADLQFADDGLTVTACPHGIAPQRTSIGKDGRCSCWFEKDACAHCPYSSVCHPTEQKEAFQRTFSIKQKERALFQRERGSETFTRYSNFRNGVEAIFSLLRRAYRIDCRQERGLTSITIAFGFALFAVNCHKYYLRMRDRAS